MSEEPINGSEASEEPSFAELLDAYETGMSDDVRVGDKIRGKVIAIGTDTIYVDTGSKTDGTAEKNEFLDDDGELTVDTGDTVDLFVVRMTDSEVRLSRAMGGDGDLHQLQDAFDNQIPVVGNVKETCKGGFRVELMHRVAFCPISQIDAQYAEDPEVFVGETFEFVITRLEEKGRNIVVSRRILLEKAIEEAQEAFFSSAATGDILDGRVSRLMPYGAFVRLAEGVEGLVHISELSWSRLDTPESAVAAGDPIRVQILGIETDDKGRRRIRLSARATQEDPWLRVSTRFSEGQKVTGTVARIADFGVFVEIAPGIEGLVHISEMSYTRRVTHPGDMVAVGDSVSVTVQRVEQERRRISLSMKDAEGDPWADVSDNFKSGQLVEGTVARKERFGVFVELSPGIVGLLPKSNMERASNPAALEHLSPGTRIRLRVDRVDPKARRISLAPEEADAESGWEAYAPGASDEPAMSDLGEKLRQALKKGKS